MLLYLDIVLTQKIMGSPILMNETNLYAPLENRLNPGPKTSTERNQANF